jgi:hypothetical protein
MDPASHEGPATRRPRFWKTMTTHRLPTRARPSPHLLAICPPSMSAIGQQGDPSTLFDAHWHWQPDSDRHLASPAGLRGGEVVRS